MDDAENALRAIAELIEPARVDKDTKEAIKFAHKVMWVFRDNPKVQDKHARLNMCHQSLMTVISCLYVKDVIVMSPVGDEVGGPDQPPPYNPGIADLMKWRNPRAHKSSLGLKRDSLRSSTQPRDDEPNSTSTKSPTSTWSSYVPDRSNQASSQQHDIGVLSQTSTSDASDFSSLPEMGDSSPTDDIMALHVSHQRAAEPQIYTPYRLNIPRRKPLPERTSAFTSTFLASSSQPLSISTQTPTTRSYSEGEGAMYIKPENGLQIFRDRAATMAVGNAPEGVAPLESDLIPLELPKDQEMVQVHPAMHGRSISQQSIPGRGRGKKSWLAYHALRSDIGHDIG